MIVYSLIFFCLSFSAPLQSNSSADGYGAGGIDLNGDVMQDPEDEEEEGDEEELVEIAIWPPGTTPGFTTAETDSTMRWFMALNWVERLNRMPGVITGRTGLLGHPSHIDIHTYEKRHQTLTMNEMNLADPVTGQVNWNRLPIHKIQSIEIDPYSYTFRARAGLREHYLVEPRTYLNFDEGRDDYRNLEFSFTHNFRAETNVELSFWDRRDGTRFPRDRMEGRQIVAKVRHHLNDNLKMKAGYINNAIDQEQSFGYSVIDLNEFHFSPFHSVAREAAANSNHSTNDLYVQMYHRPDDEGAALRAAGVHYQTDSWELTYSQDTTAYTMSDIRAFAWQELRPGRSTIRLRAETYALRDGSGLSLTEQTWYGWEASASGDVPTVLNIRLRFQGTLAGRNDDRTGREGSAGIVFEPADWFKLEAFGGVGSTIADIQSLYWNSEEYQGNPGLKNESGVHTGGSMLLWGESTLSFGLRADRREVRDGIFIGQQGQFVNIDPYVSQSGTVWLDLDSEHFEGQISATARSFLSSSMHPVNRVLDEGGERVWLKGSLYWKDYMFNRAAYVKAGLSGIFSPQSYRSPEYIVPLNRWQHGGEGRFLPAFHSVDADVSARIRWFMVLLRMENIFDRVTQQGYFETDDYPMPGRRFMFGFRVVFTN